MNLEQPVPPIPEIPSPEDIKKSRARMAGLVDRTPLLYSPGLSRLSGGEVFLKMECWQRCGCFKVRGAVSIVSMLSDEEKSRGLVTCSSGNHGAALAYAAHVFGCSPAMVFVPEKAQPAKVKKIELLGGKVIRRGSHFLQAYDAAMDYVKRENSTFIHSHDHPLVIAGQGTIGLEIMEDLPDVEAIVVPLGGGGLISGITIAVQSSMDSSAGQGKGVRLIGVESAAAPGAWLSFRDGVCRERIDLLPSLADGLSGTLTPRTFSIIHERVEAIHLVEEKEIEEAMNTFFVEEQLIVEGSAAVGLAALLAGKLDLRGKKSVLVLTGRNIAASQFLQLMKQ